ncbi:MAG: ATP-dependent DNA helicase RecG [Verrucomicrobia bacterium]|nr:ATP-dependent DNA helicase RecG [Verrucomicrobiota bacterium]
MPPQAVAPLDTPLTALWGVGPERAAQLARLDLRTVGDLLLHRPRRHEDRRHFLAIRDLKLGAAATTRGRIVAQGLKTYRKGARSVFEFVMEDGSARLHCRWWNLPFMESKFAVGDEVMVYGKPVSLKPRTIDHPETEVLEAGEEASIHLDRVVPVYPLTEGLPQRWLRSIIWRTLESFAKHITEPRPSLAVKITGSGAEEFKVQSSKFKVGPQADGSAGQLGTLNFEPGTRSPLPAHAQAIRWLHFPDELGQAELARWRLALDEFIELQVRIQTRRRNLQANARALPCGGDHNRLIKPFLARLGFGLTDAQTRVLRDIRKDLSGAYPMRRLLQGDVGSGKTVVAACTALMALESGFSAALMAPTEILAEQHHRNFSQWLQSLGIAVELQTGSWKTKVEGRGSSVETLPGIRPSTLDPRPSLTIGTHALIEPAFSLPNLGLVIIDEQHKFGVAQREALVRKGRYPHLLVMTATPIPRTLGLTLYGDLDISVIDQLPPGRGRVRTFVRGPEQLSKVHEFIRQKIAEGRQAYVVYPRIEESDLKTGMKAVTQEFERLEKAFAPHRVGLLHGRMRPDEKDAVMTDFRAGRIQVLLSTTVIEVGVDVPNATVMLIESAENYGLAQLHQLRGRIGRGAHESYCIMVATRETDDARERLRVLEETTDGFRIADADLKLRGPGELLGQQQSGMPPLRFGSLVNDRGLIEWARELARSEVDT